MLWIFAKPSAALVTLLRKAITSACVGIAALMSLSETLPTDSPIISIRAFSGIGRGFIISDKVSNDPEGSALIMNDKVWISSETSLLLFGIFEIIGFWEMIFDSGSRAFSNSSPAMGSFSKPEIIAGLEGMI